jgi:Zn-dependent protease with chaperone function
MIPIPSVTGVALGRMVLTVAAAVAPALIAWWSDRRLLGKGDDPALPELLASRRRTNVRAIAVAAALMIVFAGGEAAWGIPLLLVLLIAVAYPVRTRLLGETWGFGSYLWHTSLSFVAGFGFWIALAYAPTMVQWILRVVGPERWWLALAILPPLLAWEEWYPRLWLRAHAAQPLTRADLVPRFAAIVQRAGTVVPSVYSVGPSGSRFVNAVALPSVRRPSVAMGNALLELLDPDESTAIFAHEIAHFDHFTARRVRRTQLVNRTLIVVGVVVPIVVTLRGLAVSSWIGWVWPVAILIALVQRASKSQQHETESDLRAAALCGDPEALVRGLAKLHLHARIPRRLAVDLERAATHPSLVRRIQAIRASGSAAERLDTATVVRSSREGSWVVLDDARAYWLDGVADGTDAELTALRDAASSYRAVNYRDLAELRVVASGDERTLLARGRAGDVWSVSLAPHDVERVQRTLDVVDVRLGHAGAGPRSGTPRAIAAITLCVAMLAAQTGVVLVPIALALWKPGPAALAALGAMSIVRAAFGAVERSYWLSLDVVRLGLLGLAAIGVCALYVAVRQVRSGAPSGNARITLGSLGVVAALAAAGALWQATTVPATPLIGAPLLGTLGTVMFGIAAVLFTLPAPRMHRLGYAGLAVAASVAALGVDLSALSHRNALTETTARAIPDGDTDLGRAASGLRVSPNGASFLAMRLPGGRRPRAGAGLALMVGRVGGPVREVAAIAGDFVDDERILVLDALDQGLEVRLERVDGAAAVSWADTLADLDLDDPRLIIDRDSAAWAVVGTDLDNDATVLMAGRIGEKATARRMAIPDTLAMMGDPVVFGAGATMVVPAFSTATRARSPSIWLLPFGGMDPMRTELWRVTERGAGRVASLRGVPQCGEPLGGVAACAVRHINSVSLYTVTAQGVATEIAQLPTSDLGVVAVGPGRRVSSMTFERVMLVIDLGTRRLTRIALPPNSQYASEVRAGPGYVVTLSYAENQRSTVRRYVVR